MYRFTFSKQFFKGIRFITKEKASIFSDLKGHKWTLFSNDKSSRDQIYRNSTRIQADLFAHKTFVKELSAIGKIKKNLIFQKSIR
jgi:hypothetical protein